MADDYSNDENTTGVVLVNGPSTSGTIETAGDYDVFKVSLAANKTYAFTLIRSADNGLEDPFLEIYGPDGFFLSEADDGLRDGNARIEISTTMAGTYYLGASDSASWGVGRYELAARVVDFAADDFTNTTSTTGRVVVNGGAVDGSIQFTGDYDLFKVDLIKGQYVTFVLAAGTGGLVDPYLELYGPQLEYLGGDDESQGNHNARLSYFVEESGSYYLGARDYHSGVGAYKLIASNVDFTRDDFSNAADTTGVVTAFGPAATGVMNFQYDYDVFKVNLVAGQSYAIELTGELGGITYPVVELYGPDLFLVARQTGRGLDNSGLQLPFSYIDFTAPASGTFYIGAYDFYGDLGAYKVRVTDVPGVSLTGTPFDNDIYGGLGADVLNGLAGDDIIVGYNGNDAIDGGDGNDSLEGDGGNDTLRGGAGNDTAYYAGPQSDYIITKTGATSLTVQDKLGIDGVDTLIDIENLSFSTGTISSFGPEVAQFLSSVKGQVTKFVAGSDISGIKTYEAISWAAAAGTVQVDLSKGTFTANGSSNKIREIDGLVGSKFADQLKGDDENNLLDGGLGADRMEGGRGNDVYVVNDAGDVVIEDESASTMQTEPGTPDFLDVGGSIDKVIASISYTLGNALEDLALATGAGNINAGGNSLANTLVGNESRNNLTGGGGDDALYGGAGVDTAVFTGAKSNYKISVDNLKTTVSSTAEGTDSLYAVERLKFADANLAMDLNGNAGQTAKILGAVFGKAMVGNAQAVGLVLSLFDAGQTMAQVADVALRVALSNNVTSTGVATLLYTNLFGVAPDAATAQALASYINNGTFTTTSFTTTVADLAINTANIGLTGLASTGLAFVPA